ncbi:tRNA1(Val) (adenine(37)-N6)-methyltransferase [Photobacterium profundum]|uniref:tRNA1(Val) (adenine(37)-N6)-methyltransferase n=1 Tax=Photobacterium profundum (strain SS9) TaxID=298386 RepID=TRMN6_PHOPR|nr:methyltransferase [Photobacterium profundum]Q6LUN9.2 RecName: Full=tRNA1(Val) (adenine(37)-N6)-methyltransferase; AltName: Full=tRNA m6A37 methyltransferase [Photobacterium profundum SS9]
MAKGFTFKQFHVDDGGCGMAVSTDGVLLGAWATLPKQGKLIDIGTGSGLLALMMAQRTAPAPCSIIAIELDDSAADAAAKNFSNSPWSSSLHCVKQDIQQWNRTQPKNNIGNIICNPPYFNFGLQADSQTRATARHTDTLTHDALLQSITHLLAPEGIVSLILPEYEGRQLIQAAEKYGLQCQRLCEVKSTEKKPVSRLLIELTSSTVKSAPQKEALCIHDSGQYSAQFIALTRDFYLKL